jgi:putative two-component system response regulator
MEKGPQHRVLVVDNEGSVRRTITPLLSRAGYECFQAESAEKAWETLQQTNCSLMVLSITMPGASGIQLLEKVKENCPDLAVIMVTEADDRTAAVRAMQLGAYGYIIKPFEPDELVISVANALEHRRLVTASRRQEQKLKRDVAEQTAEFQADETEIIQKLATAAEWRDDETGEHIKRIGLMAARIAVELGWRGRDVEDIRLAALMHDIGKVGVPDVILHKPGKLTAEEFEIVKLHPLVGAEILNDAKAPLLRMARDIAFCHQEKWDGTGYPQKLAGEAIPPSARIVAVADVYDAMTHPRIYRPAIPREQTLADMNGARGKHFDPAVFDVFRKLLPQLHIICEEMDEPH